MRKHVLLIATFITLMACGISRAGCIEQCGKFTKEGMGSEYQSCMSKCAGAECPEDMAYVPPGTFTMGSSAQEQMEVFDNNCKDGGCEKSWLAAEGPQKSVEITKGFCMDTHEVTNREYSACAQRGDCKEAYAPDSKCYIFNPVDTWQWKDISELPEVFREEDRPVVCVDWTMARDYCRAMGKRLPTESEWEYAARAGTTARYYWGNDENESCSYANIADKTPLSNGTNWTPGGSCKDGYGDNTAPVGGYIGNAFGLHDMIGNVWEWTEDCYDSDWYERMPAINPLNTSTDCAYRVLRGGSWSHLAGITRVSHRNWYAPDYALVNLGVRCSRDF